MIRALDQYRVAAMDFETDPFKENRIPQPFVGAFWYPGDEVMAALGFKYDGSCGPIYIERWGEDCAADLSDQIADMAEHFLIYVHNGGRFDFHFMYDLIEPPVFINNGRLIEFCLGGKVRKRPHHVVRDSLAIIPVALDQYQKQKIDYAIMEPNVRDRPDNKARISTYLKSDCVNLQDVCAKFVARFGPRITVGAAAMAEFQKNYKIETRMTERLDREFRPWYFGGRVQCFARGILEGPWQLYDVNSEFPTAMRNFDHPWGGDFETYSYPDELPDEPVYFVEFVGENRNALPMRILETGPDGEIERTDFDMPRGRFFACSHELLPALRHDLVRMQEIVTVKVPTRRTRFKKFVDRFYAEKRAAKKRGDRAAELFAKFMLNSCYGKFGQDPRRYRTYALLRDVFQDQKLIDLGYELEQHLRDDLEIWSKPAPLHSKSFYDVSVAASITSAARGMMLAGLRAAVEPIYCDTDSVICRGFNGRIHDLRLGAWKHEATATHAAIAGRKVYCLYNQQGRTIVPVKWASKGGNLDPYQIIKMAQGDVIEETSIIPTFSLKTGHYFQTRRFSMTVDDPAPFGLSFKDA